MKMLYSEISPFAHYHLETKSSVNHQIYVEQCGNPDGIAVLFLHGGPGSGCRPQHRCYFDPALYHIILFDQRGCGRSLPHGCTKQNSSQDLISDIELIRSHLSIESWVLFGGSWGATLGLLYAQQHPSRVHSMILRGIFLGRQQDIDWVYTNTGAAKIFPEPWQQLVAGMTELDQATPLVQLFERLNDLDPTIRLLTQQRLHRWENTLVTMREQHYQFEPDAALTPLAHSIIALHYSLNQCFITQQQILENLEKITAIKTEIIHGRYDMVCPVEQAWLLAQKLPQADLTIVPLGGHAASEPVMIDALVTATDKLAQRLLA